MTRHDAERGRLERPGPGEAPPAEEALERRGPQVEEEADTGVLPSLFDDRKRVGQTLLVVAAIVAAIYFLIPRIVGVDDAILVLGQGDLRWIFVAFACSVLMFFAYVALFRGVVGEAIQLGWRESYEITMAGLAATRLFSAGGAGGIVLTYWALRKAGMPRHETATRMVCFLVLLYAVYLITLVVDGILLRAGVLPGPAPVGLTLIPAAIAGGVIIGILLIALIPGDLGRRLARLTSGERFGRIVHRLATVPSTLATGIRTAIAFVREPSQGGLAVAGAVGFWAANIAILWASFRAFGADVPLAVVVQGFFVGMVANLFPFAPGGVGAVDAGMIGTFALFDLGVSGGTIFTAVLTYRLMAFWLPIPPGIIAFVQLRRTVARWERERAGPGVGTDAAESLPGPYTSESKA